ncbi:hypothetical protein EA472_21770 [Natrarchaeobius oligotrophus]|uniref:Uncharacterized protein n=1 Tax=Natrarchaeobius chitinivorans TaxID=1679083 RepID=A0A3N6N9T0_NATCH|nr:hypothetical protein EA472_21770 [Natrarchaeobius chitinivorans]
MTVPGADALLAFGRFLRTTRSAVDDRQPFAPRPILERRRASDSRRSSPFRAVRNRQKPNWSRDRDDALSERFAAVSDVSVTAGDQ